MITLDEFEVRLLRGAKCLDVRAPIEFGNGCIPNSVNLPILNDDERAQVGTCYKMKGQVAAVELGYHLVSGSNKEQKLTAWREMMKANSDHYLTCFRGGQRSRITQEWLADCGLQIERLEGGYKAARSLFLQWLAEIPIQCEIRIISGVTGVGKTKLIKRMGCLDLEKLANHRGSAFGGLGSQPSVANFENALAVELKKFTRKKGEGKPVLWLEDESRMIGSLTLPEPLYNAMQAAQVYVLEVDLRERIEHLFSEYVLERLNAGSAALELKETYLANVVKISKRLGGIRAKELAVRLSLAFESPQFDQKTAHESWITYLLTEYYDPLYQQALERKKTRIQWRGSYSELVEVIDCH